MGIVTYNLSAGDVANRPSAPVVVSSVNPASLLRYTLTPASALPGAASTTVPHAPAHVQSCAITQALSRLASRSNGCGTRRTNLTRTRRGAPGGRALPLHVVIHRKLVGVRAETQRVVFLLFHVDPVRDEVFVEDVAAYKE